MNTFFKFTKRREVRSLSELKEHYEIEKELAFRLKNAPSNTRPYLYGVLYDELFKKVPTHPQLVRKKSQDMFIGIAKKQIKFLMKFTKGTDNFLEIGAGDCKLSFEVAKNVKMVYAADVSEVVTQSYIFPKNFELIIFDGVNIPLPDESIDIAYSNQLMEHLHQDDAKLQLNNIFKILVKGGTYLCITPNRLTGPHDISKYFDNEATGFHLKEYTTSELHMIFKEAGFSKIIPYINLKIFICPFPIFFIRKIEQLIEITPLILQKKLARYIFRVFLGVRIVATK